MTGNTFGARAPTTLDQRAAEILALLNVPDHRNEPDLFRRVKSFIECNGYEGVRRAAAEVSKRLASGTIRDPWAYTIHAYNTNLAHLSSLYTLTHLVETALRAQVELGHTRAAGHGDWYRSPQLYLPPQEVNDFVNDPGQPGIRWDSPPPGRQPSRIIDLGGSGAFLEQVTFGWLVRIVLHGYRASGAPLRDALLTPEGHRPPLTQIEKLLHSTRDARNAVAHNRYVSRDAYRSTVSSLVILLRMLRFDLVKAIPRIEQARAARMRELCTVVGIPAQRS